MNSPEKLGDSVKVMIVDDDKWICHYLSKFLDRNGFQAFTALSGEEAVELAGRLHPQLILLDIVMPDMNGIETMRKLREHGETAVVIVITGHADAKNAREAMNLGAFDYIFKPFSLTSLKGVLREGFFEWQKADGTSSAAIANTGQNDDDSTAAQQGSVGRVSGEPADCGQRELLVDNSDMKVEMVKPKRPEPLRRQRVLVVDDSQLAIDLITSELAQRGYEILSATSAERATQLILRRDTRPQLILLDVNMPNINGAQFCRFIKTNSLFSDIKVVLCSNIEADNLISIAKSYGADGYVGKSEFFEKWAMPVLD